tara:strand:- start:322 stop:1032 length:711 start_codon:yes stop_codon:yes gene_type:complete
MTNVCLIGLGSWGKKVLRSLKKIKRIKNIQIIKNRKDKKKINLNNLKWVFITTPTNSHYQLVKKYLEKKINVFCEKPLTNDIKKDTELFKLAKKNKCKLYVSDIENFKKIKIKLKTKNKIIRSKFSNNKKGILDRLAYHDFTYLYKFSNNKKISSFKIIRQKTGELNILTNINNKEIQLLYSLNSKNKVHTFNEINLIKKKNYLRIMIEKVISNKVNFDINKKLSLFANSAINIKK